MTPQDSRSFIVSLSHENSLQQPPKCCLFFLIKRFQMKDEWEEEKTRLISLNWRAFKIPHIYCYSKSDNIFYQNANKSEDDSCPIIKGSTLFFFFYKLDWKQTVHYKVEHRDHFGKQRHHPAAATIPCTLGMASQTKRCCLIPCPRTAQIEQQLQIKLVRVPGQAHSQYLTLEFKTDIIIITIKEIVLQIYIARNRMKQLRTCCISF